MSVELEREQIEPVLSKAVCHHNMCEPLRAVGDAGCDPGAFVWDGPLGRRIYELNWANPEAPVMVCHEFDTSLCAAAAFNAIEQLFLQAGWSLSIR